MTGSPYRLLLAMVGAAGILLAASSDKGADAAGSLSARQDPGQAKRELLVVHDLMRNQRIAAADASQLQLLFPDQSSLTLARGAEISIDEFRYDPRTRSGRLDATIRTGLVRYVSGGVAQDNGVAFASPGGILSLQSGIVLIEAGDDARGRNTEAILLSGHRMCLASNGQRQCTSKTGTAITGVRGEAPAAPIAVAAETIQDWFARLEGRDADRLRRADGVR